MAEISKDIDKAVEFLKEGKLVGLPTETVYGLAGNALIEKAVLSIFEVKNRPKFDPLIIHFSSFEKAEPYLGIIPPKIQKLIDAFTPGPITFLLPKSKLISDLITSGLDRVAVRIPNHPTAQDLLNKIEFPVAAPSANPFGYVSPTSASHVDAQLGDKIPLILDGGICTVGLESTIVGIENEEICVYRKGGLSIEDIEAEVGSVLVKSASTSQPAAPGMLHSHYAPNKTNRLFEFNELDSLAYNRQRTGFISFKKTIPDLPEGHNIVLSAKGDLKEAAVNLFAALRRLDKANIDTIYLELVPELGLGRAINDRMKRATN